MKIFEYLRNFFINVTGKKPKKKKRMTAKEKKKRRQRAIICRIVGVFLIFTLVCVIVTRCNADKKEESAVTIKIPKDNGTYATREWDLNIYECAEASQQHKVEEIWHEEGEEDELGFQKLYGRYLIACTDTFGEVGDEIDFYMSNGTILNCIIYDNKSQEETFYDSNPANKWGHDEGRVVLEFVGSEKLGTSPYKVLGLENEYTVKAVKYGDNILKDTEDN